MKKLIIFDMDGTILNTLDDLTDSVNHILGELGYPLHTLDEIRSYVGNGIMKLIERSLPKGSDEAEIGRAFNLFRPYYQEHCAVKTRPYDGICELIRKLKDRGYMCAVVSNKADAAVQELCKLYFQGLFDAAAGERDGLNKKPAPDLCQLVLEELNIDKSDAVYIGDSEVDIQTARNSGLDEIIVTWGFRSREFLIEQGAKILIDSPGEVLELV